MGYRLSLAARAISYEQDIVFTGPSFRSMKVKHDQAILSFDSVGKGLVGLPGAGGLADKDRTSAGELNYNATSGHLQAPLQGFTIAGEDRKFYWAQANIMGDKVVVSSPQVAKPVAVRYGWADYPVVNLYCSPGPAEQLLPASPFRTDDWPISTAPKRAQGK